MASWFVAVKPSKWLLKLFSNAVDLRNPPAWPWLRIAMDFAEETIESGSLSKYWTLLPHSKKDDHVSICPIKIALIWGLSSYAPTVEPTQVASVGCISP